MKPLLYLFSRSFVNGLIRSLTTPWRAIGTLFFVLYQGFFLFRAVASVGTLGNLGLDRFKIPLPGADAISALLFAFMFLVSWMWFMQMFTPPMGFQRADADVLFATPVRYKDILTYQIGRSSILRLIRATRERRV